MKLISRSILLCIGLQLSACGQLKPYFPDKERDYQLTTEIPDLIVPDDLGEQSIQSVSSVNSHTTEPPSTANKENIDLSIHLLQANGTHYITIEESIERAWRLVGRALSRHSIEITDRNEKKRIFFVQYDADFKKVEDGSLWDEVIFIFADDPAKEQEYQVELIQNETLTTVIVSGDESLQANDQAKLTLLTLLYNTIKEELLDSE